MIVDIDRKKSVIKLYGKEILYSGDIEINFVSPDGTPHRIAIKKTVAYLVEETMLLQTQEDGSTRYVLDESKTKLVPERKKRPNRLVEVFSDISGVPIPSNYALLQKRWINPLNEMMEAVKDEAYLISLMGKAVENMRSAKVRLTISSPTSIMNNVISLYADGKSQLDSGGFW